MVNERLKLIQANAVMPDQLTDYVKAVSGLQSRPCGSCVLHVGAEFGVLAAYPSHDPLDLSAVEEAVTLAAEVSGLRHLTVLAPAIPSCAPANAETSSDAYWAISVEDDIPPKVSNMCRRAMRDVEVKRASGADAWTGKHEQLKNEFCKRREGGLSSGSRFLFDKMAPYLAGSGEAVLYSALTENGDIAACAIGDFSSFSTAFYMFAFRSPLAPPGAADLLLSEIKADAGGRGQERVNLGLGINQGVEFFKKKWGAKPWLPYVETAWELKPESWFGRLFQKKIRRSG